MDFKFSFQSRFRDLMALCWHWIWIEILFRPRNFLRLLPQALSQGLTVELVNLCFYVQIASRSHLIWKQCQSPDPWSDLVDKYPRENTTKTNTPMSTLWPCHSTWPQSYSSPYPWMINRGTLAAGKRAAAIMKILSLFTIWSRLLCSPMRMYKARRAFG